MKTDPAQIIRQLALKLLEHATSPHLDAREMLKTVEQALAVVRKELEEQGHE